MNDKSQAQGSIPQYDRARLRRVYARLKGLQLSLPHDDSVVAGVLGHDLNNMAQEVGEILGEDTQIFMMLGQTIWKGHGRTESHCNSTTLRSKVSQLVSYLELGHSVGTQVVEIGSLYNSIRDSQLRDRCSDLLSAPGNFDRVINQATLVLEDRIRKKASGDNSLTGVQLINQVLKPDPGSSILKVSENRNEHEGICHICRGLMQAFRNPTHHQLIEKFSREDALKVCAFIDDILRMIDEAEVRRL